MSIFANNPDRHAHGFHNPENWGGLPQEFQPVIRKVLTDRFWQSGISTGSRDQFYENVNKTKTTLEGLASTIRGTIRMVRESCYSILWCMSRLDNLFYGIEALPGPLSHALFADAHCLSSHQMSILLNMTRYIIEDCPPHLRPHFLTPFLTTLFAQVDRKITSEWALLSQKNQSSLDGEDQLAEEMKEESILRQLTYIAVLMVTSILDATPRITGMVPSWKTCNTLMLTISRSLALSRSSQRGGREHAKICSFPRPNLGEIDCLLHPCPSHA